VIVLADPGDELPTATAARLGVPIVSLEAPQET
jgi:hypothetical protein